jgi:hypothetical protein
MPVDAGRGGAAPVAYKSRLKSTLKRRMRPTPLQVSSQSGHGCGGTHGRGLGSEPETWTPLLPQLPLAGLRSRRWWDTWTRGKDRGQKEGGGGMMGAGGGGLPAREGAEAARDDGARLAGLGSDGLRAGRCGALRAARARRYPTPGGLGSSQQAEGGGDRCEDGTRGTGPRWGMEKRRKGGRGWAGERKLEGEGSSSRLSSPSPSVLTRFNSSRLHHR